MTRTFIALEMHAAQQRHLQEVIRQAAHALPGIRWVDPESIHLTLAFLGELNDEQLSAATQATQDAAKQSHSFSYQLSSLGIFGSLQQPRIIWMGVEEPSGRLLLLHHMLKQELEQHGFETEKRPFSPHLTLARLKAPLHLEEQKRLQLLLSNKQLISAALYQVRQIAVFKSELFRSSPVYTVLTSCPLDNG